MVKPLAMQIAQKAARKICKSVSARILDSHLVQTRPQLGTGFVITFNKSDLSITIHLFPIGR